MGKRSRAHRTAPPHRHQTQGVSASLNLFRQGLEAARAQNHAAAIVLYRQIIAQDPSHFDAHNFLGSSLREQGDLVGAIASYDRALALRPHSLEVKVHLAEAQRRLGLGQPTIDTCNEVLASDRRNADAWLIRGLARHGLGDLDGALADMLQSVAFKREPSNLKMVARVLMEVGRKAEAAALLNEIIEADAGDFETFRLFGDCLSDIGRVREAIDSYSKAIDLNPEDPFAYANLTGLLSFTGQVDIAIAAGSIAVRLAPDMSGAHFNLAMAYETKSEMRDAIKSYGEALRCKPDLGVALLGMCRLLRYECVWEGMEASEALAQQLTYKRGEPASPFGLLTAAAKPSELLECNRLWASAMAEARNAPLAVYTPRSPDRRNARIRVGYLSADFHQHATTALIAELFELHDRERFETFGYSIGNSDESWMRRRVVDALDHFVDLNAFSHQDAATRIRSDDIDILIDLKGYTSQARPQIVACRPAPIQVNYLGYPSTMGAPFVDYMIVDPVVAPVEHQPYFTECLVQLPDSYQPNDRKRRVGAVVPTRRACGLPDDGFVFCCFNANYKLNAMMFDVWMRVLDGTPGAVLWLLESNAFAPDNLRREASARGVDPNRLVFAPKLPAEDHLARMAIGDLFLDTLPIGAHTTASEALWTGLPVLTCLGEAFPGRVGASLVSAMGLPELIAPNLDAYEAMARRLAREPAELAAIKVRLCELKMTAPLFDSARYVKNYEAALRRMMELRDEGEPPRPFAVE